MSCGAITPVALHFVRNHGAVPHLDWSLHRIRVCGNVTKRRDVSMDELKRMPTVSFPMSLVSAGNRRKEKNMLKQTTGFNWGAGAISNTIWTGVPLRDVLRMAGVTEITLERQFVCFFGPSGELSRGVDGSYGTCIPLSKALDPSQDVIIAYAQNGETLRPDHGYPARVIIPGYTGGRMVKWLTKIEVTRGPSTNFYHLRDNRILPSHVDSELAEREGWWKRPEYAFNELNINSVISSPAHGDAIEIFDCNFTVKGYAYSGGGRSITRVEVSLDNGMTWRLARHCHPCPPTKHGKQWCWAHWTHEIPRRDFVGVQYLTCRAWDESNNTQPGDLTWNMTGMGSNHYFKIRVHSIDSDKVSFDHPTEPGTLEGGWMGSVAGGYKIPKFVVDNEHLRFASEAREFKPPSIPSAPPPMPSKTSDHSVLQKQEYTPPPLGAKLYRMKEIEQHDSEDDAWILIKDRVFDVNRYISEGLHPGGNASITMNAGTDATEDFEAVHSAKAWNQLEAFAIGYLDPRDNPATVSTSAYGTESSKPTSLSTPSSRLALTTGPVNLLQYALSHPEMYGDTLVGEAAEAAAFNRMWQGAQRDAGDAPVALDPKRWIPLVCDAKVPLSHDTILLRLKLESESHQCGLPVGYHLYLRGERNGKKVMRAYTPSSLNGTLGTVEFVIKIYFPNDHPTFPEGGQLTQYLNAVNVGDVVEVKGPMGHIKYVGCGSLLVDKTEHIIDRLTMIGGGTGVAPMLQMIVAVLANPADKTKIRFLFANKTTKDILLKYTLDRLQRENPDRFSVHYTVSKGDKHWSGSTGRVNKQMIEQHCFPAHKSQAQFKTVALLCGPPSLEEDTCIPALKELGYGSENIIQY
tara:strand:- start:1547 stop:4120 length:2574 start_codon:yes stop_codon:yes gene_type:complete